MLVENKETNTFILHSCIAKHLCHSDPCVQMKAITWCFKMSRRLYLSSPARLSQGQGWFWLLLTWMFCDHPIIWFQYRFVFMCFSLLTFTSYHIDLSMILLRYSPADPGLSGPHGSPGSTRPSRLPVTPGRPFPTSCRPSLSCGGRRLLIGVAAVGMVLHVLRMKTPGIFTKTGWNKLAHVDHVGTRASWLALRL